MTTAEVGQPNRRPTLLQVSDELYFLENGKYSIFICFACVVFLFKLIRGVAVG